MKRTQFVAAFCVVVAMGSTALAQTLTYQAFLSGPNEDPPVESDGSGFATLVVDLGLSTYTIDTSFSGLTGATTVAHIHGPTASPGVGNAGVMTPTPSYPDFPSGVMEGTYSRLFDLTDAASYNANFNPNGPGSTVSDKMDAFLASLASGSAYLNIHSTSFPPGEIRGFFALVPEPTSVGLIAIGLAMVGASRRRNRQPRNL